MDSHIESHELVEQLIKENLNTKAPYLDLAFCGLQGDEPALEMLAECTHLKGLNMSYERQKYNEEEYTWVKQSLSDQNMRDGNYIEVIPDYLPTSLEELCIGGNENAPHILEDITPLARLKNLRRLYLNHNDIEDISPLQWLTQLENLSLNENCIEDLHPLTYLRQLSYLDIGLNQALEDLTPLQGLTNLRCLRAEVCNLHDISPLHKLHRLEVLDISYSNDEILDLTPLQHLTNLRELYIGDCEIGRNLAPLAALNKLKVLVMESNFFAEEEHYSEDDEVFVYTFVLPALSSLEELNLRDCEIKDLRVLPYLPKLRFLNVSENPFTELLPEMLEKFPALETLYLWGHSIENLPPEVINRHTQDNCLPRLKAYFTQNK